MNHPTPDGWGTNLTEPEFITNQTGRLGINVNTDPNFAADMFGRANAHSCQHDYEDQVTIGE